MDVKICIDDVGKEDGITFNKGSVINKMTEKNSEVDKMLVNKSLEGIKTSLDAIDAT